MEPKQMLKIIGLFLAGILLWILTIFSTSKEEERQYRDYRTY